MLGKKKMEEAKIVGLACQEDSDLAIVSLNCQDKFRDIALMQATNSQVIVKCPDPATCEKEAHEVVGSAEG